ncbi:MAG: hypothetical protein PHD67_10360 [Oscillospiraceae bacterium]|nr:hypothetical protein [Oscillospiraceae bacterium]
MKTKAEAPETFRQKTMEFVKGQGRLWQNAGVGLLSFFMANAALMGDMAPFGVAVAAAARRDLTLAAGVGAMAGYLFSFQPASNSRYLVSLILVLTARWALGWGRAQKYRPFTVPLLAFAATLAPALLLQSFWGIGVYDVVMAAAESVLCAGAAFFFMRAAQTLSAGTPMAALSAADRSCVIITFALLVIALGAFTIGDVSVGRVIAVVAVLLAARYGREGGGAIAGVTAGVAMGVLGGRVTFLAGSYGLGGLLAGMFAAFGPFGCAVAFVLVNGLTALIMGTEYQAYAVLYEGFVGSVLVMLIPSRLLGKIRFFSRDSVRELGGPARDMLLRRLGFASQALEDISEATSQAAHKLSETSCGSVSDVYSAAVGEVCRKCPRRSVCWGRGYSGTMDALNGLTPRLREAGAVGTEDFSEALRSSCRRLGEMAAAVNREYRGYESRREARRQSEGLRGVVTGQFHGLAVMLDALAEEIGQVEELDGRCGERIGSAFCGAGVEPLSVSCFRDAGGRAVAEVVIPEFKLARVDETKAALDLSEICGEEFDLPAVTKAGGQARLLFTAKPYYRFY